MTTLHKAAQMALDALEWCEPAGTVGYGGVAIRSAAITALREALAAPPAAPAPAAPVPGALVEAVAKAIYWEWRRDAGYVPWVDGGNSLKQDDARKIARAVVSSAAPVVPEPVIDEMDAIASKYAHKLALDLECVLLDYHGKWWNTAMQTLGEYRSAMNAIHERESPTHMGEPVLPRKNCDRPDCPAGGYGPCAPCEREHSGG